jgi:hypothetical protein
MDNAGLNQDIPQAWRPIQRRDLESILSPDPGETRTEQNKRFFAIVSESTCQDGKMIRRVLIFDDNPASLRLLSNVDTLNLEPREQRRRSWVVIGCLLLVLVGLGMIWPLL